MVEAESSVATPAITVPVVRSSHDPVIVVSSKGSVLNTTERSNVPPVVVLVPATAMMTVRDEEPMLSAVAAVAVPAAPVTAPRQLASAAHPLSTRTVGAHAGVPVGVAVMVARVDAGMASK